MPAAKNTIFTDPLVDPPADALDIAEIFDLVSEFIAALLSKPDVQHIRLHCDQRESAAQTIWLTG